MPEPGYVALASPADFENNEEPVHLTPLWALRAIYFVGIGANACLWRFITVFYSRIGLDNGRIGLLQLLSPWVTFSGSLLWALVCDWLGEYKRVLVLTNSLGALAVCCLVLRPVQSSFVGVLVCVIFGPFFLSSRTGVTDALTLQVVQEYEDEHRRHRAARMSAGGTAADEMQLQRSLPSYGEQRLWGAAGYGIFGLLSGVLTSRFGSTAMFIGFGMCLGTTVLIIATQLPPKGKKKPASDNASVDAAESVCRFEVAWFFANLLVYGAHMALVESFLFVYILRDFRGADQSILGASVATMCLFELPVFSYIKILIDRYSLTTLLSACHAIMSCRLLAYSALPKDAPWLVLLVEPLHGITMAAMWACSVEYGRRLAPKGKEARMQALVSGTYYRVASGAGAFIWGILTRPPPLGYGFEAMYRTGAMTMCVW
eukprot:CAMPEP_0117579448 /NCGR_PEP_ID=MMETSP0784-20121206/64622_1 /TAXON_ID=39447 /ORGANISM="" /LENGTH=429 /DNA_ID=CAMNT_0005379339 /DNA_START=39 /DNA_END=1325 /DNA_ORIENTATION=+